MTTNDVFDKLEERVRHLLPEADDYMWFDGDEATAVGEGKLAHGKLIVLIGYVADESAFETGSQQRRVSIIEISVSLLVTLRGTMERQLIRKLNDATDTLIVGLPNGAEVPAWYTLGPKKLNGVAVATPVPVRSILGEYAGRRLPIQIGFDRNG